MPILVCILMNPIYSTSEVAKAIGVDKSTLLRWLYAGKLPEPKRQKLGGIEFRIWSQADMERARLYRELKGRKRS